MDGREGKDSTSVKYAHDVRLSTELRVKDLIDREAKPEYPQYSLRVVFHPICSSMLCMKINHL